MRPHVLDANALYRYLTKTDGGEIVSRVIKDALLEGTPVYMSVINWGEVYYTLAKRAGLSHTENRMAALRSSGNLSLLPVTVEDSIRAARLKARYALSYADCFAAAITGTENVLVTPDPDFQRVPKIRLLKLPRAGRAKN